MHRWILTLGALVQGEHENGCARHCSYTEENCQPANRDPIVHTLQYLGITLKTMPMSLDEAGSRSLLLEAPFALANLPWCKVAPGLQLAPES